MFSDHRGHLGQEQPVQGKFFFDSAPNFGGGYVNPKGDLTHGKPFSRKRLLRSWENQKVQLPPQFFGFFPGWQQPPLVRPHDPEKFLTARPLNPTSDRFNRVGNASPSNFLIGNFSPTLPLQASSQHGQSSPVSSYRADVFQGRVCAGKKHHLVKPNLLLGGSGNKEMPKMKGVKRAAKKTDLQS